MPNFIFRTLWYTVGKVVLRKCSRAGRLSMGCVDQPAVGQVTPDRAIIVIHLPNSPGVDGP